MIRFFSAFGLILLVSACAQYREPTVNCFNFMAVTPVDEGCDFQQLIGPEPSDDADA
ncbi:MAG: hypothetical protein AAF317_20840 [Pseudomonadota bacterium]